MHVVHGRASGRVPRAEFVAQIQPDGMAAARGRCRPHRPPHHHIVSLATACQIHRSLDLQEVTGWEMP